MHASVLWGQRLITLELALPVNDEGSGFKKHSAVHELLLVACKGFVYGIDFCARTGVQWAIAVALQQNMCWW